MASSSLYITSVTAISFVCFVLTCASTFLPVWGYFEDGNGGFGSDRGYFGPWKVCKELTYDREKCDVSRFKPSKLVLASGIAIAISSICLLIYFILCVIRISSRNKNVMQNSLVSTFMLVLSVIAATLTLASAGMFAIQTDDLRRGFRVSRGVSFYLVIVAVVLTIVLCVMGLLSFKSAEPIENTEDVDRASAEMNPIKRSRFSKPT